MILVDTSALVDSLVGPRRSAAQMRGFLASGERLVMPAIVLYEWRRGPRLDEEIAAQEALLSSASALPLSPSVALRAAELYRTVRRPRGREIDLLIAAHALILDAQLWTLNPADFRDLSGLSLVEPTGIP